MLPGMELSEWQRQWDALGKDDPFWVVLTDPTKKGGKWDPAEFFATGEKEIEEALTYLESIGLNPHRGVALDFGCAVGRLSQPLARYFEKVHGVDISPSMLEHARRFNRQEGKVEYHLNSSNRLEGFANNSIDFIYSNLVLQHIEPRHAKIYLQEFIRVLTPGAVALVQLMKATSLRRIFPQALVDAYRKLRHGGTAHSAMFGIPEKEVWSLVQKAGAEIVDVRRAPFTRRWISCSFALRKKPATQ